MKDNKLWQKCGDVFGRLLRSQSLTQMIALDKGLSVSENHKNHLR